MSMRTVCEFNHDYAHKIADDKDEFLSALIYVLQGGDTESKTLLRRKFGLTMAETSHHSDTREYYRNGRMAYKF